MFKNAVSKIFIVLAVLASALVTISFVERSTPSKADLSQPSRPAIIPLPGNADLSDYFLRHSERTTELSDFYQRHTDGTVERISAGIPVTGADKLSDFYQRFQARTTSAGVATPLAESLETPGMACESPVDCR
jgi:hypothetical protein